MKNKRILIVITVLLLLSGSYFLYQGAYAKYRKKVVQTVNISLAKWDIKINSESIAGKQSISSTVIPIFEANDYIAEGVIAPGASGYFDIEIDATDVDVSFGFELDVVVADQEKFPDIIAYGYIVNPGEDSEILEFSEEGITGEIAHNTPITKLRIYIKWDDSSENVMDNAADTALAIGNATLGMNATFVFTQINQ